MDNWMMACRVTLALWLGTAGIFKLREWRAFRRVVLHFRILPRALSSWYAAAVPLIEIAVALLLISGIAVGLGAVLAGLLLLSFAVAVAINLGRGRTLECHCFGQVVRTRIGMHTLTLDALLLLPAAILAWQALNHRGALNAVWSEAGEPSAATALSLGVGYTVAVCLLFLASAARRQAGGTSSRGISVAQETEL